MLLVWIWDRKNIKRIIFSLLLVYLVTYGCYMFLKGVTGRVRPYFYFQEAYDFGRETLWFMFGPALLPTASHARISPRIISTVFSPE